jgi:hypothetical protein
LVTGCEFLFLGEYYVLLVSALYLLDAKVELSFQGSVVVWYIVILVRVQSLDIRKARAQ